MSPDVDVVVVGSGPAGVSAAFPLVEAGLKVLLVDGGHAASRPPLAQPYLQARAVDEAQWKWMLGRDYYALRRTHALSPKMRVPAHAPAFDGFARANLIECTGNYVAIGSLAQGGLSNAWGCGVARLSRDELGSFPVPADEMNLSYARVASRIGISGATADDLTDYFGVDDWADPPIEIDVLQGRLLGRYQRKMPGQPEGVRIGRSRVAALSRARGSRGACDLSGNCLWGCQKQALYCAEQDLRALQRHPNFLYRPGFVVERVSWTDGFRCVMGQSSDGARTLTARKVVLAAGTLATTRLALLADGNENPVSMQSCPVAAFMLWIPGLLGIAQSQGFGLGQLSYTVDCAPGVRGFGSLFSTSGIPVAEFARFTPLPLPCGIDVLRALLSSCVVGNLALPGHLTHATLRLDKNNALLVDGQYDDSVPALIQSGAAQLRRAFRRLGAWVMPGSFRPGIPGADIHYAASLPMRASPDIGQTDLLGELTRQSDLHIVDGASLPVLTEKSHTLTIMANADRISRELAIALRGRGAG